MSSQAQYHFRFSVTDEEFSDLRRRVATTRWPDREIVNDHSQGVELATIRKLADHWATDYDWRKVEKKLNSYPQFVTKIDGLEINFIHVRFEHTNALHFPSGGFFDPRGIRIPVAVGAFPDEIYQAPKSWAEKAYPKLIFYNRPPKGGHFAAWEQPSFSRPICAPPSGRFANRSDSYGCDASCRLVERTSARLAGILRIAC